MKKIFFAFLTFSLFLQAAFSKENSLPQNFSSDENSIFENSIQENFSFAQFSSINFSKNSIQKKSFEQNSEKENPQKTAGWDFFIEPKFGVRIGKEGEIVWANNSQTGENYKLSELEWEYTPAFYLGADFLAGYKRLEISFLSKFFLPTKCGTMKDSDWLQDAGYQNGNTSVKTNYSESKNSIESGQDLELMFALKFFPTHFLTLRPKISVNFSHMKFAAKGGTYWYGNDDRNVPFSDENFFSSYYAWDSENVTKGDLGGGTVIEYDARNLFLWTGLQADFMPTKKIVLSVAAETAPLVYMVSYDHHVLRDARFKQYSLSVFYAFRGSFFATFKLKKSISLSLNFAGVFTGETFGPSFYKENNSAQNYVRDGDAGAYSKYLDFGLSAKFLW